MAQYFNLCYNHCNFSNLLEKLTTRLILNYSDYYSAIICYYYYYSLFFTPKSKIRNCLEVNVITYLLDKCRKTRMSSCKLKKRFKWLTPIVCCFWLYRVACLCENCQHSAIVIFFFVCQYVCNKSSFMQWKALICNPSGKPGWRGALLKNAADGVFLDTAALPKLETFTFSESWGASEKTNMEHKVLMKKWVLLVSEHKKINKMLAYSSIMQGN